MHNHKLTRDSCWNSMKDLACDCRVPLMLNPGLPPICLKWHKIAPHTSTLFGHKTTKSGKKIYRKRRQRGKINTFSVAVINSWVMLKMLKNSCNLNLGWRRARTPSSFAHLPWAASHAATTASVFSRNTSALFRIALFQNIV